MVKILRFALIFTLLIFFWSLNLPQNLYIDTDIGRDLNALADLYRHHFLWLGPHLSVGFPASPVYYYQYLPLLFLLNGSVHTIWLYPVLFTVFIFIVYYAKTTSKLNLLILGLSPIVMQVTRHPGNGFIYAHWLLLSLVLDNFYLSALALGMAIACHPAALVGLPILIYRFKKPFQTLCLLLLPWTPIFIFEIITRGFLVRQLIEVHANFTHSFPPHYFFGLYLVLIWLLTLVPIRHFKLLILLIFLLKLNHYNFSSVTRNLNFLSTTVNQIITAKKLDSSKSLNLLSILGNSPKSPAGDDYRFFFKQTGYKVSDTFSYSTSDQLLVITESSDFDWNSWHGWEKNQFFSEPANLVWQEIINDAQISLWVRQSKTATQPVHE